jgi:SsrA-binding protein
MKKNIKPSNVISTNRSASYSYELMQKFEAGMVLTGSEIKSLRLGRMDIRQAYARPIRDEIYLVGSHIAHYEHSNSLNHDPERTRKLLLHKTEVNNLIKGVNEQGYTIVPTRVYIKNNVAKVEIALARGKRQYDKRQAIMKRETDREMQRSIKNNLR